MRNKNNKSPFSMAVFIAILGISSFSTNIYGVELLPFPQRPQNQRQIPESVDDRVFLNRIDALGCPDLFALREGIEKISSSTPDPRDKDYYLNYLRMINNVIVAKKCSSK